MRRHFRPRAVVAEHAFEHAPEEARRRVVEPAYDPPVEQRERAVGAHEHVACVHITVERTGAQRRCEPHADALVQQRRGIDTERGNRRRVVDGHTVEQLHRDHARAAEVVENRRHDEAVDLDLLEHRTEPTQRSRLVGEVDFLGDLYLEAVHETGERAGDADGHLAGDEAAQRSQHREVDGDATGHAGA